MQNLLERLLSAIRSAKDKSYETICDLKYAASLIANGGLENLGVKFRNTYRFECFDAFGNLKWVEEVQNAVMTEGVNDMLTNYFKGSAYTAAFYVGLVDNAGFTTLSTVTFTMASHTGWSESTAYSNTNRPTLTLGAVGTGSVDNSGSPAVFNINATATINGAFVSTNNTKGGTTGKLFGAASFGATRSVISGDTLNVTVTLSAS